MKIALLNLPYDNNYGGNLQRYALMKVLTDMGHEVTHINLRSIYRLPYYIAPYCYAKRFVQKYILGKDVRIDIENYNNRIRKQRSSETDKFYNKYIKHTEPCFNVKGIIKLTKGKFDAFVVGSDQVWRKDMIKSLGIQTFFLGFTKGWNVKRIAYGISVGTDNPGYSKKELCQLTPLYRDFDSVTVRESCLIDVFNEYGWNDPQPSNVLDPTLLLDSNTYDNLISAADTNSITDNKIYCYVLDRTPELLSRIDLKSKELGCEYVIHDLDDIDNPVSIEQWLRNIRDSRYVITDSYHGTVFSIIFNRPFEFCGNTRRGNARVNELLKKLHIKKTTDTISDCSSEAISSLINSSLKKLQIK